MITNLESAAAAFRLVLTIGAIGLSWQYILKPSLINRFRQRIFSTRRDMFIFMANGHIDRRHPAYVNLRTVMNSMLRYAGGLGFVRTVLVVLCLRQATACFTREIDRDIESIQDDAVRRQMRKYDAMVSSEIRILFATISPISWLAFRVFRKLTAEPTAQHECAPDKVGVVRSVETDAKLLREAACA